MRARMSRAVDARINVTPMIDVVMCLIVFFLIVGRLAADRLVSVDLPESGRGHEATAGDPIVINVSVVDGRTIVTIEGRPIAPADLVGYLDEHDASGREVRLRADRALPFGELRGIVGACRRAGVGEMSLATERSE